MSESLLTLAKLKPFSDLRLSDSSHGAELLRELNAPRKAKTFCNVCLKTKPGIKVLLSTARFYLLLVRILSDYSKMILLLKIAKKSFCKRNVQALLF